MALKRWILVCSLATAACGGRVETYCDPGPCMQEPPVTNPDPGPNVVRPNPEPGVVWGTPKPPPIQDPDEPRRTPTTGDMPIVAELASSSTCASAIPAGPTSACEIAMPPQGGPTYYVSSKSGADANAGTSPSSPLATLRAALAIASEGASILVAEGDYTDAEVVVDVGVSVKGGFDAGFAHWDPEEHPARVYGQLSMYNDHAVVGGFRFIGRGSPAMKGGAFHRIGAGTLVRNHIEVVYEDGAGDWGTYAIVPSTEAGHSTRLACNDIYVRRSGSMAILDAIAYGNVALHAGQATLEYNRVCNDSDSRQIATVLSGYGTCENGGNGPATISAHDNVFELAQASGAAVDFYDCGKTYGMNLTFDHNTFISGGDGIRAAGPTGKLAFQFTNNIFYGRSSFGDAGEAVTTTLSGLAQNNLVFGFSNSTFALEPAASQPAMTEAEVFVAPEEGNFTPLSASRGARIPR